MMQAFSVIFLEVFPDYSSAIFATASGVQQFWAFPGQCLGPLTHAVLPQRAVKYLAPADLGSVAAGTVDALQPDGFDRCLAFFTHDNSPGIDSESCRPPVVRVF